MSSQIPNCPLHLHLHPFLESPPAAPQASAALCALWRGRRRRRPGASGAQAPGAKVNPSRAKSWKTCLKTNSKKNRFYGVFVVFFEGRSPREILQVNFGTYSDLFVVLDCEASNKSKQWNLKRRNMTQKSACNLDGKRVGRKKYQEYLCLYDALLGRFTGSTPMSSSWWWRFSAAKMSQEKEIHDLKVFPCAGEVKKQNLFETPSWQPP